MEGDRAAGAIHSRRRRQLSHDPEYDFATHAARLVDGQLELRHGRRAAAAIESRYIAIRVEVLGHRCKWPVARRLQAADHRPRERFARWKICCAEARPGI